MASDYAYNNQEDIKALILYASYREDTNDLSKIDITVLFIWGTKDGVVQINKIIDSKKILPRNSIFKSIEGGNDSQYYNALNAPYKKMTIIKYAGHTPFLDNPSEFCNGVKEFLSNINLKGGQN